MSTASSLPLEKVGFQTIIYGRRITDLDSVLTTIKAAGFSGVEFFQHHKNLLFDNNQTGSLSFDNLYERVQDAGLVLLGLAGGTLEERIQFCQESNYPSRVDSLYLYVDDLDDHAIDRATELGLTLAFHPHAFTRYDRLEDVVSHKHFSKSNVKLLPDTAHMFIAGDDPRQLLSVLSDYGYGPQKIVAIHLKDWTPDFGHAPYTYAKGFTELGQGVVPLPECIKIYREAKIADWVVEQDYSGTNPNDSIAKDIVWLQTQDVLPKNALSHLEGGGNQVDTTSESGFSPYGFTNLEFTHRILNIEESRLTDFYQRAAVILKDLFFAKHVSLWAYSNVRNVAYLMGTSDATSNVAEEDRLIEDPCRLGPLHRAAYSLSPYSVTQSSELLTLANPWREWIKQYDVQQLEVLAIADKCNPHHVRLLVSVLSGLKEKEFFSASFDQLEPTLSYAVDTALRNAIAKAEGSVRRLKPHSDADSYCSDLADLINLNLPCESTSVFLQSFARTLECRTPQHIVWNPKIPPEGRFYRDSDAKSGDDDRNACPTALCWKKGRFFFLQEYQAEADAGFWRSHNRLEHRFGPSGHSRRDALIFPLRSLHPSSSSGSPPGVIGVLRCSNRLNEESDIGERTFFTEDDAAILTAVCDNAKSQIELLLEREFLSKYIALMTHEMQSPMATLAADLYVLADDCDRLTSLIPKKARPMVEEEISTMSRLRVDIESQLAFLTRIINDTTYAITYWDPEYAIEAMQLDVEVDLILPIRRLVKRILQSMDLSTINLHVDVDPLCPKVLGDNMRLQQVLRNLILNAVKYKKPRAKKIEISISAEWSEDSVSLLCSDFGVGIQQGYEGLIFEQGVRIPGNPSTSGLGLGLFISKRIMLAHGGDIRLENANNPTTFRLTLPRSTGLS